MKKSRIFWMLFLLIWSNKALFGVYIIRDAMLDDKSKILALYQRCNKWYSDYSVDSNLIAKQVVTSKLYAALNHGFAFVVEDLSDEDQGRIVAFLLKNRPMGKAYNHIIDCSLSCVDPEFYGQMLMTQLYLHLLKEITDDCPYILRVEGVCPVSSTETCAMYERCGFVKEAVRTKCMRRTNGSFDDEQLFVWWNPNFDPAARQ